MPLPCAYLFGVPLGSNGWHLCWMFALQFWMRRWCSLKMKTWSLWSHQHYTLRRNWKSYLQPPKISKTLGINQRWNDQCLWHPGELWGENQDLQLGTTSIRSQFVETLCWRRWTAARIVNDVCRRHFGCGPKGSIGSSHPKDITDLDYVGARTRLWKCNSFSWNGTHQVLQRKDPAWCVDADTTELHSGHGSKGGWESEAKEDSAIKGSSCDGAKRRISVDWESSSGAKSSWRSAVANHKSSSRSHVRGLQDGISCDSCSWGCDPSKQPAQGVPLNHSQWWTEVWSWRRRKPNLDRLHRCFICTWLWGKPWLVRCPFRLISRFLEVWPTRFRDIVDSWSWAHWDHRGHGDGGNWRTRHLRLRAAYAMQDSQCLRVNGLSNTFLVSSWWPTLERSHWPQHDLSFWRFAWAWGS